MLREHGSARFGGQLDESDRARKDRNAKVACDPPRSVEIDIVRLAHGTNQAFGHQQLPREGVGFRFEVALARLRPDARWSGELGGGLGWMPQHQMPELVRDAETSCAGIRYSVRHQNRRAFSGPNELRDSTVQACEHDLGPQPSCERFEANMLRSLDTEAMV